MTQLRSFNQSKGGTKAGLCLQNVRLGFGIPSKYAHAWDAWKNTEQHKNRKFPKLDVPLFYDYTTKGNRYGHINVRLADGRVWNDGKLFGDFGTFEQAWSNVKYVGWGESVNGVKVIEEDEMLTSKNHLRALTRQFLGRNPDAKLNAYLGKSYAYTVDKFHKARKDLPSALKRVAELERIVAIKDKEVAKLKAQTGDATKWQTLKALIKELISKT